MACGGLSKQIAQESKIQQKERMTEISEYFKIYGANNRKLV